MADPIPTDRILSKDSSSPPKTPPSRKRRLLRWILKYSGYAATAASLLWTGLLVLVAKNEINLVVWVEKQSTVYPSEASMDVPLPLNFEATPANSVRTAALKISNYGKTTIGVPAGTWTLTIEAPSAAHLRLVNAMKVQPNGTVAFQRDRPKANAIALEIGAFQPRASIDIIVLLVNDRGNAEPVFRATPTLPGLPHELSFKSPQKRVQERLFPAVFALTLVLAYFAYAPLCKEDYRRMRPASKEPPDDGTDTRKPRSIAYLFAYFGSFGIFLVGMVGLLAGAASYGVAYIVSYTL